MGNPAEEQSVPESRLPPSYYPQLISARQKYPDSVRKRSIKRP